MEDQCVPPLEVHIGVAQWRFTVQVHSEGEGQGSRKCVPGIPLVSDKSSFVGQIEIEGYVRFLYFVQSVGQFDQFILYCLWFQVQ